MNYNNNNNNEQLVIGELYEVYKYGICEYILKLKFDNVIKEIFINSSIPGVSEFITECENKTRHHMGRVAWKCREPLGVLLRGRLVGVLGEVYYTKEGKFGMVPSYVGLIPEYDNQYNKIIAPEMPGCKRRMPKIRQPREMLR